MSAPERLDRFMARANAAYYAIRDPFADFTTAPEITQMFGELIGAWAAVCWGQMAGDAAAGVLLVEAGPGRGTLMADALRAVRRVAPDFAAALRVHLIETSPRLRAIQREAVPDGTLHDALASLPAGKMILIANEFLDALPIRQFVRRGDVWLERWVTEGAFCERPAADAPVSDAADGTIAECGEDACDWVAGLAQRLAAQGGVALLLDYGPSRTGFGDTLQALRAGSPADPLAAPGEADLTAHVDFAALAAAARAAGCAVYGPMPQGLFLERLGLFQRAQLLAAGQSPARAWALMDAARRLALPERMGQLFKVMAICNPALPAPPGFES